MIWAPTVFASLFLSIAVRLWVRDLLTKEERLSAAHEEFDRRIVDYYDQHVPLWPTQEDSDAITALLNQVEGRYRVKLGSSVHVMKNGHTLTRMIPDRSIKWKSLFTRSS